MDWTIAIPHYKLQVTGSANLEVGATTGKVNMPTPEKALVLLSGGIDSVTTLAMAKSRAYQVYALSFNYGQRHQIELERAKLFAKELAIQQHLIFDLNLRQFGASALTSEIQVPKNSWSEDSNLIPVTYVPARNTIFLSIALGWAESLGANRIFIGANALDYSGYPDCRPEFINAFQNLANLATKLGQEQGGIKIEAPLINLTKAQIIQEGIKLGLNYANSISCYDPNNLGHACGSCDACLIRKKGFNQAGISDPTHYTKT